MGDAHTIDLSRTKTNMSFERQMAQISERLKKRKILNRRMAIISDINSGIVLISIILMIIANELTFRREHDSNTKASWSIKIVLTILTAFQLLFVFFYNYFDWKLYAIQNTIDSFIAVLTYDKLFQLLIEIIICIVHPVPRSFPHVEPPRISNEDSDVYSYSHTPVDIALSLIMFLRLYLLTRSIMFHSQLVRDTALQSFGYLNRVSITFGFLIRTYLVVRPLQSLLIIGTIIFFIGSWSLRACDYQVDRQHFSMSNSMWVFAVTFTTVGYGDIYPSTYCGRTIAAFIGLFGLLISALSIAVLTQKLLLSREENYVHTFVMKTELSRQRRIQAANTVKYAIKLWYLKRKSKGKSLEYIQLKRQLFRSISDSKGIKDQQINLNDNCLGLIELHTNQQNTNLKHENFAKQIDETKTNIKNIEIQLNTLTHNVTNIETMLYDLVHTIKGVSQYRF